MGKDMLMPICTILEHFPGIDILNFNKLLKRRNIVKLGPKQNSKRIETASKKPNSRKVDI